MRFLITAGGTREYIDPVRFISNASSGKTGYALARAAAKAGHEVKLITAPTNIGPPAGVKVIAVQTAAEMFAAVKSNFDRCDCLIMAAAVADFTPARPARRKIKKSDQALTIKLKPTVDILKWAGKHKKGKRPITRIVVGFALEDRQLRQNAEKKLAEKNLDMIIANSVTAIGAEMTSVEIKTSTSDWLKLSTAKKATIAKKIIRLIEKL